MPGIHVKKKRSHLYLCYQWDPNCMRRERVGELALAAWTRTASACQPIAAHTWTCGWAVCRVILRGFLLPLALGCWMALLGHGWPANTGSLVGAGHDLHQHPVFCRIADRLHGSSRDTEFSLRRKAAWNISAVSQGVTWSFGSWKYQWIFSASDLTAVDGEYCPNT